jgi:hypothetical protein
MKRFVYLPVMIVMLLALVMPSSALAMGATQFSGTAYWPAEGQCADSAGAGSDYAVHMTGDLEGCHYTFIETSICSPGGGYNETGHEVFVGTLDGQPGTFRTTYRFTAKLKDCSAAGEIAGRCQHPLVEGSGTGVFEGLTGRLDMRDIVEPGVGGVAFPYRGHLYPVSPGSSG